MEHQVVDISCSDRRIKEKEECITRIIVRKYSQTCIQDTRYFIFQIRAPGRHDTTFIISTYTINKVKYNDYCIKIHQPFKGT